MEELTYGSATRRSPSRRVWATYQGRKGGAQRSARASRGPPSRLMQTSVRRARGMAPRPGPRMIVPLTNEDGKREITEGMKGKTASLLPRDMASKFVDPVAPGHGSGISRIIGDDERAVKC
ncbi:hypothetical protein BJ912DRAFT_1054445 [Pholiota molesta]|nr:hypothetical protein BJ912DRAFT_1054445 [Pholiota molesta]